MSINGEFERTTYTRDQLLCLCTPRLGLNQCVRTLIDSLITTRPTIRGCRGGQHSRPAPVYTESGSMGVRIIPGNRPVQSDGRSVRASRLTPVMPLYNTGSLL